MDLRHVTPCKFTLHTLKTCGSIPTKCLLKSFASVLVVHLPIKQDILCNVNHFKAQSKQPSPSVLRLTLENDVKVTNQPCFNHSEFVDIHNEKLAF